MNGELGTYAAFACLGFGLALAGVVVGVVLTIRAMAWADEQWIDDMGDLARMPIETRKR